MTKESSTIHLNKILRKGSSVRYLFQAKGPIKEAFLQHELELKYDEDIDLVPESILAIPFATNVLPIIWVYDAELSLDEIDANFYNHIDDIKTGYKNMYPSVQFGGSIKVQKIIDNETRKKSEGNSALLFSGGADASSSLVTMLKEGKTPRLITLWGSDVALDDVDGWHEKSGHTKRVASLFKLDVSTVKTNFQSFIDGRLLSKRVEKKAGDTWWHGFQHGIGIIGHAAPIVYKYGSNELHIAASFVRGDTETCASDPTIDENVYMGECSVVHNGYSFTRQDKLRNIQDYLSYRKEIKQFPIKVCYSSRGAKNCGHCEKCMRTACGIIVEGGDINFFGLEVFDASFAKEYITKRYYFSHTKHWERIQQRLIERNIDFSGFPSSRDISWILDIDFSKINNYPLKKIRHVGSRIKSLLASYMSPSIRSAIKGLMGK